MQLVSSSPKPDKRHSNSAEQQAKAAIAEALLNEKPKVAPFCINSAGEKTPKTDLSRLLDAACDCV